MTWYAGLAVTVVIVSVDSLVYYGGCGRHVSTMVIGDSTGRKACVDGGNRYHHRLNGHQ